MQKSIDESTVTVAIPGTKKKYEVTRLGNFQLTKVARLVFRRKDFNPDDPLAAILEDNKLACKVAAAITIRGFFSLKFRWWFRWRWFYYIRQYDIEQLYDLIDVGIKALPFTDTIEVFGSLHAARETLEQMTMASVEGILSSSR